MNPTQPSPPGDDPVSLPLTDWPQPPGQSAPCGLLLITADGFVMDANRTAARWFGPCGTELRSLAAYLGVQIEETGRQLTAFLQAVRKSGQALPLVLPLVRRDGTAFNGELTAAPLIDPGGIYLGCDLMLLDVSQRRRLEGSVAALQQQELERRMSDRTRQLAAANRDLDVFSQLVSHDLRTPLRHLNGYMALMRERIENLGDGVLIDYQQAMNKSLQRMSQMVEGLLEFSRLGRVQLDPQTVPLGPLLQGVVARLRHEHQGRAIDWRMAGDLPVVRADAMLMAQVFTLLLDNAAKFTGPVASPVIEVGWAPVDERFIALHIVDNGVGFDRSQAPNLFVMFQRQHHSMDFPGLGTGLALAQRIVERHGGEIRCESAPGQGCRVVFTLPVDGGPGNLP